MNFINSSLPELFAPQGVSLGMVRTHQGKSSYLLPDSVRSSHIHIIGATGSGKSKLIELFLRQDIEHGHGACLLDPHGDLYRDVLKYAIEKRCIDRVIPFDLTNTEYVLGFNPIQTTGAVSFKAKQLREACGKAWGVRSWDDTPRLARWLYSIFYVLVEQNLTMLDALTLAHLSHTPERAKIVKQIQNPEIKALFQSLEQMKPHEIREQLESSYNRLFEFLNNAVIRRMFAQKHSLNLRQVMQEGKILLCNFSTRNQQVSVEDRNLLGTLLIHELYSTALLREAHERTPFHFYIDEFSHFVSLDIAHGLAETRKFQLGYVLAHQDLSQLKAFDERLYSAVMTNTRTKMVFGGLSDADRELLAQEVFAPDFDMHEVKAELYQTKQRSHLELREVEGISETTTQTQGVAHGKSASVSKTNTHSQSRGQTESVSSSWGQTQGRSSGTTQSYGSSQQQSTSQSHGETHGTNSSRSNTSTNGSSWGQTTGSQEGRSQSSSQSQGSQEMEDGLSGKRLSSSSQQGLSSHWGSSRSHAQGGNSSTSHGEQQGESFGRSMTHGSSQSSGQSQNYGSSEQQSISYSQQQGRTQGNSVSESHGRSEGTTSGKSYTETSSYSTGHTISKNQTWVTVQEEYQELSSRTFYTLDEQLHRAKSYFAKLQPAQMIVKVQQDLAFPVQVHQIEPLQIKMQWYHGFLKKVSEHHPFFLPKENALEPTLTPPRPQQHHQNPPKKKPKEQPPIPPEVEKPVNIFDTEV